MNKCDLEETKKQVEDVLDEAFSVPEEWVYIPNEDVENFLLVGEARRPGYGVTVRFQMYDWSGGFVSRAVYLNGVSVGSVYCKIGKVEKPLRDTDKSYDRYRTAQDAYKRWQDEKRCKELLTALNPPGRKKSQPSEYDGSEFGDIGSSTTIGAIVILLALIFGATLAFISNAPDNSPSPQVEAPRAP